MGWPVFPCEPRGKRPIVARGLKAATTDPEQIDAWWRAHPDANVAMATGAIFVVDIDCKEADGFAALAALTAAHGPLPDTPWQETGEYNGRRGRQYAFAAAGLELRNFSGVRPSGKPGPLGLGIDGRGRGGYVLLPPSVHPSGVRYEWRAKPSSVPLAPVPDWIVAALARPAARDPAPAVAAWDSASVPDSYIAAAVDGEYRAVASTPNGGRNGALNIGAFKLGAIVATGRLSRADAERALRAAASANGLLQDDGLAAVDATIKSGIEAGMREPRVLPERRAPAASKPRPALKVISQERPAEEATPEPADEPAALIEGARGAKSIHNAIRIVMAELPGLFVYDDFAEAITVTAKPPWALNGFEAGALTDSDLAGCVSWLERQGVFLSIGQVRAVIGYVAAQRHAHPVRDYLSALIWDGVARLDHWLIDYLGAADTSFARAAGAKWLIGAVARVMRPGAKVDTMLILEGPQGARKSAALAAMATLAGKSYFTDDVAALGSKDAALQLRGNLIVELAELDAMERADVAKIKAFISRQVDKIRRPYASAVEAMPRQCVFAGTINPDESGYLRDSTGGRRFWPVACGAIDTEALAAAREQLWAEAVWRYRDGEHWWLEDQAVVSEAMEAQQDRREVDPLIYALPKFLSGRPRVTTADVLDECWGFPPAQRTVSAARRAAAALRAMGWERRKTRAGSRVVWAFFPPPGENVPHSEGNSGADGEHFMA